MPVNPPIENYESGVAERPRGEAAASPLPGDKIPHTSKRKVAVVWICTVVFIVGLNALVTVWLNKTVPNSGYRRIRKKWAMLNALKQPVDNLILGDSSGAQGLDPVVLSNTIGGKGINLCTIGDMTVVDDAAMLDNYVHRFGAPKRVILVHVYDVWPRIMSGYAYAQTPLTASSSEAAWYSKHNDSGFQREVFMARNVKLLSETKSLLENLKETIKPSANKGPGSRADGFTVALEPDPNGLAKDIEGHLSTAATMDTKMSPDNAEAMDHIGDLIRQYHLHVYFVNAPISDQVMRDPTFVRGYREMIDNVQLEVRKVGGTMLLTDPMQFPPEDMENVDHVTYSAAEIYSARVADEIKKSEATGLDMLQPKP